jgi:RNA polymerase sigma-70 factor (ECF subfamily)
MSSSGPQGPDPSSFSSAGSRHESLIVRARQGDREAFDELVRACQGYLMLIANEELDLRLRAKIGASDLVQNTLLHAEEQICQFRGSSREALLAWLRTILRNEIHGAHRSFVQAEKRNVRREVSAELLGGAGLPLTDARPSPRAGAMAEEEALRLRSALARLSADHRRVVVLRNWDRLPFEEIGRRMGRSTEAVKKLWARALLKLQDELNREPD